MGRMEVSLVGRRTTALPTPTPSMPSQQNHDTPLIFQVLGLRALHFHVLDCAGRPFVELAITVSY